MLSYRHSFHAGNFADVLKHTVLVEILASLIKKDKPFDYIDTHAGAGLYHLKSNDAKKLEEYNNGIAKLKNGDWPELERYFSIIDRYNKTANLHYYPGSPLFASDFLRTHDKAWLYELHPKDFSLLSKNVTQTRRLKIFSEDGLQGLLSLLPPQSRRALVLVDPSYEVKAEYEQVFDTIDKAYKKFATGIYAIWYPVVERQKIDRLQRRFIRSGIKDIQRFELGLTADTDKRGMTASGMLVINPPWGLFETMSALLPKLLKALAQDDNAFYKCDVLVGE